MQGMQRSASKVSSNQSLTLDKQLDGVAAALKEASARIELARLAAQTVEREAALARSQPAPKHQERNPEPAENPNRILSLAEAAQLTSLSSDTLRRRYRAQLVQLSERRYGLPLKALPGRS
jgi:hypothetical protein